MAEVKTVVSAGLSRTNNNKVRLELEDEHSSDVIIYVEFSLEEFALLVTGLHGIKGKAEFNTKANIAKKRETQRVSCAKVGYDKEVQRKEVLKDFKENHEQYGWELHCDGVNSQQNGSEHIYSIKRYEDAEDPLEVERYY